MWIRKSHGKLDTLVEAYSDSDWGSLKTPEKARRKSTSSGIIVLNGIQVLSFSRTQKATASSSCEAELYALSGTCGEAILVGRLFEFLTEKPVSVEVRCDSSSARQWTQRRRVGRLKHVDVRLCQLQDWVRDNIVKLGTVKTALNVADLNTTKLSCARRAFLLYHLSQVEYFEGEEIVRTGEDEYDKYEQEKRLKEYVGGNQVKNPHQTHSSVQCNSSIDRILDQRKPCSCRDWRSLRKQPYHGKIGYHVYPVGYCSGSTDCTEDVGSLEEDHETHCKDEYRRNAEDSFWKPEQSISTKRRVGTSKDSHVPECSTTSVLKKHENKATVHVTFVGQRPEGRWYLEAVLDEEGARWIKTL